jgi:hypothetical protein
MIGHQIHQGKRALGALGLVYSVSNHDGSGRISPCESWLSRKKASLKKMILKFSTNSVVPDAIWNVEQF